MDPIENRSRIKATKEKLINEIDETNEIGKSTKLIKKKK